MSRTQHKASQAILQHGEGKGSPEGTHLTEELLAVDDGWKKNGWFFFSAVWPMIGYSHSSGLHTTPVYTWAALTRLSGL